MDRYKTKKSSKQTYSMDGMLSGGPRKSSNFGVNHGSGNAVKRPTQLDDFSGQEGYSRRQISHLDQDGVYDTNPNSVNRTSNNNTVNRTVSLSSGRRGSGGSGSNNRSKKNKPKKSKWKIFKRFSLFSLILIVGVFGVIFGKAWWDANKALQGGGTALAWSKNVDPNSLTGEGDGRVNVLLMGKGGDMHEGGQLIDTIMIASIDPINNGVVMLSIPRDLWVKPDDLWPMKINAVYNSAKEQHLYENPKDIDGAEKVGIAALEEVIEEYMEVKINYYGMVDFAVFEDAVNVVGGITVNMPEPYYDPTMLIGNNYLSLDAGPNDLDGGHALGLARSRYGAERGDFDRGENQQLVIIGIKDKALSAGTLSNPLKLSQLVESFGDRVQTNFSIDDVKRLYDLSKDIPNENITNIDLAMEGEAVVTTGTIGGQSVVYPIAGIDDYSEVQKFVRLKFKDSFIIKEDPSIIVLNASGKPGAATKRADELKSYGYNVTQVADAPVTDIEYTQLVDNTGGKKIYTKRYLELRFGTEAVSKVSGLELSPYVADYIVVIGQNG